MLAITGEGTGNVLRGIAAVLWPVVVCVVVLILRAELKDLLRRLRRGRVLGQEIELDESLTRLSNAADAFQESAIPAVPTASPSDMGALAPRGPASSDVERQIADVLAVAPTSPRAALMQLAADLERAVRRLLAATGHLYEIRTVGSLGQMAQVLERVVNLPRGSLDVFREFAQVRNNIVHGKGDPTVDDILRAIDAGVSLLRAIAAVPRERNFVLFCDVDIFADVETKEPLPGKAVILETTSPGGAVVSRRVFPTLRDHFRAGMEVSWEWSSEHVWENAWYRDPETGDVSLAWSGSAEFVGRDLESV